MQSSECADLSLCSAHIRAMQVPRKGIYIIILQGLCRCLCEPTRLPSVSLHWPVSFSLCVYLRTHGGTCARALCKHAREMRVLLLPLAAVMSQVLDGSPWHVMTCCAREVRARVDTCVFALARATGERAARWNA